MLSEMEYRFSISSVFVAVLYSGSTSFRGVMSAACQFCLDNFIPHSKIEQSSKIFELLTIFQWWNGGPVDNKYRLELHEIPRFLPHSEGGALVDSDLHFRPFALSCIQIEKRLSTFDTVRNQNGIIGN